MCTRRKRKNCALPTKFTKRSLNDKNEVLHLNTILNRHVIAVIRAEFQLLSEDKSDDDLLRALMT